eukprot:SAG22_NODE_337_length_12043_cov_58.339556_5_plen_330_part_00
MPSDWAAPIDSIPSGTAHLAERYPPLPGDAAPPASFYDDAERWRSVAAEYRERGFVVVRQLMSGAELAHLRESVQDYIANVVPGKDRASVFTPEDDLETLQYFAAVQQAEHEYLYDYGNHPRWRHVAAACLGEPFTAEEATSGGKLAGKGRPSIQYFNKVPSRSLPTPAHQDNFYFKLSPPNCLTVWMALDPIDGTNGLLNYVPGSHLEGVLPHHSSNVLGFSQSLIEWEGTDVQVREVAVGSLQPGDCIVHHCNAIHRADANDLPLDSGRYRRSVAVVYSGASAVQDKVALQEYLDDHDKQVAARPEGQGGRVGWVKEKESGQASSKL